MREAKRDSVDIDVGFVEIGKEYRNKTNNLASISILNNESDS